MNNDTFYGVPPSIRSRRFGGVLCAAVFHLGAWYLIAHQAPGYLPPRPAARAPGEIILRFFTPAPARAAHPRVGMHRPEARRIAIAPPDSKEVETGRIESREAAPEPSPAGRAAVPAVPSMPAMPEDAAPVVDRESVKKAIAEIVAEDRARGVASGAPLRRQGGAAQTAIGQAFRRRCEDDRAARSGNVQLSGLMKLPSLMLGAVSDKGCKW